MIVWGIIYFYIKQQLKNEFNLDNDLLKKVVIKSGEVNAKNVYKNFKKHQKKLMMDIEEENPNWSPEERKDVEDISYKKQKEFKSQMSKIILFNDRALKRAYLHPF